MRVAIDTGGTFTDCVYFVDGVIEVLKVFSTPADPSQAVLHALRLIDTGQRTTGGTIDVRHGTTLGTNTMLERTGARVAFVTTAGFEDTIAIGRQTRTKLYDWMAPVPVCLVPRELRFGVPERVSAEGMILRSPSSLELNQLVESIRTSGAESVAISLLFSFAAPETELRLEEALRSLSLPISTSHRILPEFREYERASTIVVNAYLAPRIERYLMHLEQEVAARHDGGRVEVMQSSGGIIPAKLAAQEPVRTVLSGPAGGVIGACHVARWAGFERIIGFDVGGTSTDVFLAESQEETASQMSGGARLTRESVVAGVPIGIPMLEIYTAGAGGGSIARFDAGGLLRVGPESAGADPGPICFGRGVLPTVTDANLVLGRLDPGSFLGGKVTLDRTRTERILLEHKGPLSSIEQFAVGILRVIEAEMEKAIRVISVERGHDTRQFTLVAFGGGGPLHACSLARALRIPTVLIPNKPGALSAVGILLADVVRDYSLTVMLPGDAINSIGDRLTLLEQQGLTEFAELGGAGHSGVTKFSVDLRYQGQGHELNIPIDRNVPTLAIHDFHTLHRKLFGFSNPEKPLEIVNLRLRVVATGASYTPAYRQPVPGDGIAAYSTTRNVYFEGDFVPTLFYRRDALIPGDSILGPAIITEYTSATVVPPGDCAVVDGFGNLVITIAGSASGRFS